MKFGDWRAAALGVVLAVGALLAWGAAQTPPPLGADAPAGVFSAARAMIDDRAIAAKPHPIGSAEAGLVRSYLLQRMQTLGLDPRTTPGVAVEAPRWFKGTVAVGARVENLVGVLKGTDPSLPAVLLMAHSDSVPGSPGAADDAAGVASAFETVRALKAQGPHKRDVAVLITDGEEAGLLGARAFFASGDPLLKHIGEVVNLEARGGGGRVNMFQMGEQDGGHLALFRRVVADTNANSLTSEVYKYMPNDTDFTVSRAAGYPGFNFAFIGSEFDYHSPSSTPAALDQGSLQHMGDQALAVTRALADAPALPAKGPDAAYSDLLGKTILAYPAVLGGWIVFGLAVIAAAVSIWRGQQLATGHGVRVGPLVWGAVGSLIIVAILVSVLWSAAQLVGLNDFARHRALLAQYPVLFAGVALLTVGGALFLAGPVQRGHSWTLLNAKPETRWGNWAGAFLLLALLSLFLQIKFPPMAMLTAWPLLAAALVMAAIAFVGGGRFESLVAIAAAGVVGVFGVAHLGHFADQTFTAIGESLPELLALFVLIALPMLYPLVIGWGRGGWPARAISAGMTVLGVGVLVYAALRDPSSVRTPSMAQAFYLHDSVANKSFRASGLERLDPWSSAAIGAPALRPERRKIEVLNGSFWLTPAPLVGQTRPVFTSSRDGDAVVVHIAPQVGGRELRMALKTTVPVKDVTLDGQAAPILGKVGQASYVRWSAPSDGLNLRFKPAGPGELNLTYAEIKDGWPTGAAPSPKPATAMPWGLSDTTVLTDELKTQW